VAIIVPILPVKARLVPGGNFGNVINEEKKEEDSRSSSINMSQSELATTLQMCGLLPTRQFEALPNWWYDFT